jgi:hypothetical protein
MKEVRDEKTTGDDVPGNVNSIYKWRIAQKFH